ncbi:hypothetical protein IMC75_02395 [Campylobacter peloridis]|uniref:Helix-turn-helix domain-containing protein n=1 Tax=Campylobacter peloridis TaxID=488546 RepID=A0ABX6TTI8_9BACT|nr:hypothetical protein [Campylobacter peloridis]AJC85329.1 hypothetical protein CPEL_1520 [Campylobacter peloridis LMG 23910]QOQ89345.1 hypothetical protein IMC75_02395 [Campylobacter peloridis]
MDNWTKLQDLNLVEVQRRTQIELACLELIVKKDFKTLSRFNVNGYIKILQREYDLDFTSFLEEYHAYLEENGIEKKNHVHISPRVNSYTKEGSNLWYFVIIIAVVLIILIAFGASRFFQNFTDENTTNILEQEQVVLEDKNDDNKSEEVVNFFASEEKNPIIEENKSDVNVENNITLEQNQDENITNEDIDNNKTILLKESVIKPSAELWIGMIDLKDHKKSSMIIKKDYVLSLQKDMLITTGHAAFTMNDENNNTLEFKNGLSKFLIIKDGQIKQITKAEFMKENKGKLW